MNSDNLKQAFDSKVRLKTTSRRPKVDERTKSAPIVPMPDDDIRWHSGGVVNISAHALDCVSVLMREAGLGCLIGPSRFGSSAGIRTALAKSPSFVTFYDEFGSLICRLQDPRLSELRTVIVSVISIA